MKIHINDNQFTDKRKSSKGLSADDQQELVETFKQVLKQKNEPCSGVKWVDNDTIELNGVSPIALHSFILKAEELGKNVTYTKKTVIEIS